MTYHLDDTICAIASAPGGAARGIVRASGPEVVALLSSCFHSDQVDDLLQIQRASAISGEIQITTPENDFKGRALPCELYLWPDQRSYTREPIVEIHTIGSPPLLAAVVEQLIHLGARSAEPGEFTLRAFLAGRIDLTQAEAVLGVIDAQGEQQLNAALNQLAGGIAQPMRLAREQLLAVLAELEAGLDFVEEDIEFITPTELDKQLAAAEETVSQALEQMKNRTDATDAPRVVLIGEPNAGKSSLFNALIRFDENDETEGLKSANGKKNEGPTSGAGENPDALVSQHAGTTRDYLTARLDLEGLICELIDTAGVESIDSEPANPEPENPGPKFSIAQSAQAMSDSASQQANLRLLCFEATKRDQLASIRTQEIPDSLQPKQEIVVLTKWDMVDPAKREQEIETWAKQSGAKSIILATSSETLFGIKKLRQAIRKNLESTTRESSGVLGTAARCVESLCHAVDSLARARELATTSAGEELVAAEVRYALAELGKVVGAVYTDDILDRVFSQFCIGK